MPRKESSPDPERQLMIKTKTCQRLLKEVAYYEKEVKENEAKLEEMKANQADPYDIKHFKQVLDESYMMVPDSQKRLQQAVEDLSSFLEDASSMAKVDNTGEWYTAATKLLEEHSTANSMEQAHDVVETKVPDLAEGEAF